MYYIYHVKGVKIGCTSNLKIRMRKQGFVDYEILEEHTDIYEASKREIQLQKQYGYKVDTQPYYKTIHIATKEGRRKSGIKGAKWSIESGHMKMLQSLGGKAIGKINTESGHLKRINKIAVEKTSIPVLQYDLDGNLIKEHKSIRKASREIGIDGGTIRNIIRGNTKNPRCGYIFQYKQ